MMIDVVQPVLRVTNGCLYATKDWSTWRQIEGPSSELTKRAIEKQNVHGFVKGSDIGIPPANGIV